MSKTDKTRPWDVKVLDRPEWLVEHHDHRDGVCDLPPRPTKSANVMGPRFGSGSCGWEASRSFWHCGQNRCGCPMCTDQAGRRLQRRRDRRRARKDSRDVTTY